MFYVSNMTTIQSIRKSVGKNIKEFREELGLTQERLAEQLELSTSHIANIESGRTGMSDDLLCRFCNTFNKKPSEIYSDIDMDFEFDKRVVFAVNDSVSEALKDLSSELSAGIVRRLTTKLNSGEFITRRNERIQLRKVASPKKK